MPPTRLVSTVLSFFVLVAVKAAAAVGEAGDMDIDTPVEKLSSFAVLAGRMPTGNAPGAVLNSVEVATTPGATARKR